MRSSVESRNAPNGRALAGHARVAAVERVHDRADDEGEPAEEEELFPDQDSREHVQREPGQRDRVGRQARLDQPVADELATFSGADRSACASTGRPVGAATRAASRGVLPGCHRVARYPLAVRRVAGTWAAGTVEKRHAAGRARASQLAAVGRGAGGERSEQRVDDEVVGGDDDHERHHERVEQPEHAHEPPAREPGQRPADHQRERDVHRRHGRVGVVNAIIELPVCEMLTDVKSVTESKKPHSGSSRGGAVGKTT